LINHQQQNVIVKIVGGGVLEKMIGLKVDVKNLMGGIQQIAGSVGMLNLEKMLKNDDERLRTIL
jgi:hypothetical protein